MTILSSSMSFQRSARASPTRIDPNTIKVTIVLVGLGSLSITALISPKLRSWGGLEALFFGSLTPIAGFLVTRSQVTAWANAERSAACILQIVYGESFSRSELKNT